MIIVAPVVLTVVIVARIAAQPDGYISWAVFAALLIAGATTVLQAARVGRVGAGHVLIMGTSGAFIAVCVAALMEGGPTMMASLIVVSSLFQFALAARLSLLRRIFTPAVSRTVIMLIPVTVMPIVFDSLKDVPDGASPAAAPATAVATLVVIAALILRAPPALRLWSPLIGIVVGCSVGALFGLYDTAHVLEAPWVGAPLDAWPGFDLTPDAKFWALLPAFVVVTLVGAIETIGDGVAIQRVSQRTPRATDFRVVQGALNADGVGNLLSGIAGTLPNTTYSTSISLADVTGIAARRVGMVIGVIFMVLAFFPKVAGLLIAIPGPVASAYLIVLLALLFVQGMRIIVHEGVDHRKATVTGLSFWLGVGFQSKLIFADALGDGFLGVLLGKRHDVGRHCRDRTDAVHGDDDAQAQASASCAGQGRFANDRRVSPRHRDQGRMERCFDGPVGVGWRGDAVEPAIGRGRRLSGRRTALGSQRPSRRPRGGVGVCLGVRERKTWRTVWRIWENRRT